MNKFIILLAAGLVASTQAATCDPNLCDTPDDIREHDGTCSSNGGPIVFDAMDACCALSGTEKRTDECYDSSEGICRVAGFSNAACDYTGDGDEVCYGDGGIDDKDIVYLNVSFTPQDLDCCPSCTCWGDPFCTDFEGNTDRWVLCDGRSGPDEAEDPCKINQDTCEDQLDGSGAQCYWQPDLPNGERWVVKKHGSQCIQNPANPKSWMVMHRADDIKVSLLMGDRGVITRIKIYLAGDALKPYIMLKAKDCVKDQDDVNRLDAWTVSSDFPVDTDWLDLAAVYPLSSVPSGIVGGTPKPRWIVQHYQTGVSVQFSCLATEFFEQGELKHGPYRINIEALIDPDLEERDEVSGYCASGSIAEKLVASTWEHTENIHDECSADPEKENYYVAKVLCGTYVQYKSDDVENCIEDWCTANVGAISGVNTVPQCIAEINTEGWNTMFCAVYYSGVAYDQCVSELEFGNDAAMGDIQSAWETAVDSATGELTPYVPETCISDPANLLTSLGDYPDGDCTPGVQVQVEIAGEWVDFVAFSAFDPPCPGLLGDGIGEAGESSQIAFPATEGDNWKLLAYPVRFKHCDVADICYNPELFSDSNQDRVKNACAPVNEVAVAYTHSNQCDLLEEFFDADVIVCKDYETIGGGNPKFCIENFVPLTCPEKGCP